MKHTFRSRMLTLFLAVLMLVCTTLSAQADGASSQPAAESETVARLLEILDFKFFIREDGIGKGSAPVYTAPSEKSIRLSDGKASCSVEAEISVAGYVNDWLMVRYELGKKADKDRKVRVGYIPPKYSRGYAAKVKKIDFDSIPAKLAEATEITDNPRHNSTPFGTLPKGTAVTILAKYTYSGNWWYVETKLDGKLTRGFINRSTAAIEVDGTVYRGNEALGIPAKSPEGTGKIGTVTAKGAEDDAFIVRKRAGTENNMVARVYGGETFPCYGTETMKNGKLWYYIWVDGVWGWIAGGISTFTED